jgi:hypothetical protein
MTHDRGESARRRDEQDDGEDRGHRAVPVAQGVRDDRGCALLVGPGIAIPGGIPSARGSRTTRIGSLWAAAALVRSLVSARRTKRGIGRDPLQHWTLGTSGELRSHGGIETPGAALASAVYSGHSPAPGARQRIQVLVDRWTLLGSEILGARGGAQRSH